MRSLTMTRGGRVHWQNLDLLGLDEPNTQTCEVFEKITLKVGSAKAGKCLLYFVTVPKLYRPTLFIRPCLSAQNSICKYPYDPYPESDT